MISFTLPMLMINLPENEDFGLSNMVRFLMIYKVYNYYPVGTWSRDYYSLVIVNLLPQLKKE